MSKHVWIFYIATIFLLTLFSWLFIDPNFIYLHSLYTGFFLTHKVIVSIIYFLLIISAFAWYLIIFKNTNIKFQKLKKILSVLVIISLFAYPAMLSYDIFSYIAWEKILVFYKENPYILMPQQFPHDPFFGFARYTNIPVNYGIVWVLLSAIAYAAGFGNYLLILFNFKLIEALFFIGTLFLLWKLSKGKQISVMLFGLNPLVLLEVVQSGHNDIIMIFFALFSYFLLEKKKVLLAIIFFICSVLIKYVTIALLPVFLYMLYKQYKKETINWEKIFLFSSYLMIFMFLLSFAHKELYPWYAVWFLPFIYLIPRRKFLFYFAQTISFGLILSDLPYMYLGMYSKLEIIAKYILMVVPMIVCAPLFLNKKLQKFITV